MKRGRRRPVGPQTCTARRWARRPSTQAEALYRQAMGASAGQRPTDVIVVSSKGSTVSDGGFRQLVAQLAAQVRTAPGVTHVAADLSAGSQFVSSDHHAALIALRA